MRHHNANRKFGREKGQRLALMRSLARSLIVHGKITTTTAKAKELRSFVEKLVTRAKISTLASRRLLQARTGSSAIATKLVTEIGPKYKDRRGGYIRIAKVAGMRKDGSEESVIEFV
ncbi:MAG TPA: 50S ribosomal protein L17 [Candidatus Paceibacterota bacterium]